MRGRRAWWQARTLMGLAAAALYVACVLENEKKTQKEIAEIANVTEVTVRNRYKGLKDALGLPARWKGRLAKILAHVLNVVEDSAPLRMHGSSSAADTIESYRELDSRIARVV